MRKIYLLLIALLVITCKTTPKPTLPEIEFLEPKFEVTSIYIIQADLVVTEFEAVIKIDNPNNFAADLSSIKYELYGNNHFWSDGVADNIFRIPANCSSETKFRFKMNFINTSRKLLDDVINMRQVNYRFKGQAEVKPDVPKAAVFNVQFDCSGFSDVKRKATD